MSNPLVYALVLLALLQAKHLFADFYLQTPRMLSGRAIYLHVGRTQHVGVHILGSLAVMLVCGVPMGALIGLLVVEALLHYHIDFAKGWWSERTGFGPTDSGFWRAFGVDQLAHQWTYIAMAFVLVL